MNLIIMLYTICTLMHNYCEIIFIIKINYLQLFFLFDYNYNK